MARLRVVAYNIQGARAGIPAVAGVIESLTPDVVCLNEAPGWWGTRKLARRVGLRVVVGVKEDLRNVVLVNNRLRSTSLGVRRFSRTQGLPPRGFAEAVLGFGSTPLAVLCAHLGLVGEERLGHVRELLGAIRTLGMPAIVAGDWNEGPMGVAAGATSEVLADTFGLVGAGKGFTYPNPEPSSRIDYVFASAPLRVEACFVPDSLEASAASDHRPVVADLEVG
ncbi:MAG: endonuclease/exonuclease/phosphatase family protein [Actinomycetota bacterium]